ncbi:aldo/keto reductase [Kordiimonas sp.]|uniref:aldo/keto reductase n=1 Tax=Kordiimonas sp. TaxID=1970157 RepID=UPI003A8E74F3
MRRTIGNSGIEVNAIGLGCMGLTAFYGKPVEEQDGIALIHEAMERGVDHFDTAEMYGPHTNETLLGKALKGRREKVVLATKFGIVAPAHTGSKGALDGSAENCRRAVEGSLRRLQTDYIDLYYLHRLDPETPIEETVGAMARLVEEGKIRAIGLSEVSADSLRRAAKVHPIAAVQSEYSIFTRAIEETLFPALEELNTSLVAYSPLGRGMLAGAYQNGTRPEADDWRSVSLPRFEEENLNANRALADEVISLAGQKDVSASQLALAWVLAQNERIVTIPGTTKLANLISNLGAYSVDLTGEDLERLAPLAAKVAGSRYSDFGMKLVDA